MMRYYIDTCIWIDFLEGRTNDNFLVKCIQNEDTILYSYVLDRELHTHIQPSKLIIIYALLKSKELIEYVGTNEEEKFEAKNIALKYNIPFADSLHAVLSRNNDAILVTRDKHFKLLTNFRIKLL